MGLEFPPPTPAIDPLEAYAADLQRRVELVERHRADFDADIA